MASCKPKPRVFRPLIQRAYSGVHQWLSQRSDTEGYNTRKRKPDLDATDMKNVAAQFARLFPTHFFKVAHVFDKVIGQEALVSWLQDNPHICFIDVGCGSGAASAAFIESIVRLGEGGLLNRIPTVHCIGVDPCNNALALYEQLVTRLAVEARVFHVGIKHVLFNEAVPGAMVSLAHRLESIREEWKQPCLPHVIVAQVNLVRPFRSGLRARKDLWADLESLGIPRSSFLASGCDKYGFQECLTYRDLLMRVPVDHMHIVTVATTEKRDWRELVGLMQLAIDKVLGRSGEVTRVAQGRHRVGFENPDGGFWKDEGRKYGSTTFHVDVSTVTSADWQKDANWHAAIDSKNLMLAWARVRQSLQRGALVDEIEIRLFDRSLERNIERLQMQLCAYAEEVTRTGERLPYDFPKSEKEVRPRVLSRMEEEILSVAIIQQLGQKFSDLASRSYAYRPNRGKYHETEYLYDWWFPAWQKFGKDVHIAAQQQPDGVVMRVDVTSYFTQIEQAKLVDLSSQELRTGSARVKWLLRCLLLEDLRPSIHKQGFGITQGGVGSGFFANVYLSPIDAHFGVTNLWNVEYFRYVDDIILIVPDPDDVQTVRRELNDKLRELELELNPDKTEICSLAKYLKQPDQDDLLDRLSEEFEHLESLLWIMDSNYRYEFAASCDIDAGWWGLVKWHRDCLARIGFHIDEARISRKIWQYLGDEDRIDEDLAGDTELSMPRAFDLPELPTPTEWANSFRQLNPGWVSNRSKLRQRLIRLFRKSKEDLRKAKNNERRRRRKAERRIRFCVYRLCRLGIGAMCDELVDTLQYTPWILRQARQAMDALAQQDFRDEIMRLLAHYQNCGHPMGPYMRATILRALRYLATIDAGIWDTLTALATDESTTAAERLMATETWLHLAAEGCSPMASAPSDTLLRSIQSDLAQNRLKKNHLLMLGTLAPIALEDLTFDYQDPIMLDAQRTALHGETTELMLSPEPKMIREEYYSGQYPAGVDEAPSSL